jgi:hypothetical protein
MTGRSFLINDEEASAFGELLNVNAPEVENSPALVFYLCSHSFFQVGPGESGANGGLWEAAPDDRDSTDVDTRFLRVLQDEDLGFGL